MSKWQSERSIHEMLKDTPPLRESSDSIVSGTEAKLTTSQSMPFTSAYAPPESQTTTTGPSTSQNNRMTSIKDWSLTTLRCTKQMLYEKLGKSSRTVDTELEGQVESLRDTQRKYQSMLRLSATLAAQLSAAARTQRLLADAMAEQAQRSPELRQQFLYNADTQRAITRNGETLLSALQFFNNSLNTLTNKTIEDTLITVRQFEAARVEYDAHRNLSAENTSSSSPSSAAAAELDKRRQAYERLREDVAVKLGLLHENRIKVMNKQLLLFHNAIAAYFSGNKEALDSAVRHFNVKPTNNGS